MYKIQVDARKPDGTGWQWVDMRPTGGEPYQFLTKRDAKRMAAICYPDHPNSVRVVRV